MSESTQVQNAILHNLPDSEQMRFLSRAEYVHLNLREVVIEPGKPIPYIDFVESGMHSMVSIIDGDSIEVATVGNEGMIGVPVVMGSKQTIGRVLCQVPGSTWRIGSAEFQSLLPECPKLASYCTRFAFSVLEQTAQNSACNRVHTINERCAKWLLFTHDRTQSDQFELTQEFLAEMLGVRRNGVGLAAGALQNAGLIKYSRGRIRILNRSELEEAACECYSVIRASLQNYFSFMRS